MCQLVLSTLNKSGGKCVPSDTPPPLLESHWSIAISLKSPLKWQINAVLLILYLLQHGKNCRCSYKLKHYKAGLLSSSSGFSGLSSSKVYLVFIFYVWNFSQLSSLSVSENSRQSALSDIKELFVDEFIPFLYRIGLASLGQHPRTSIAWPI